MKAVKLSAHIWHSNPPLLELSQQHCYTVTEIKPALAVWVDNKLDESSTVTAVFYSSVSRLILSLLLKDQ